jgi:hypothetical protein
MKANPADIGPETTPEGASVSSDRRAQEGDAPGCTTAAASYLYVPARTLHAWMYEGDLLGTALRY